MVENEKIALRAVNRGVRDKEMAVDNQERYYSNEHSWVHRNESAIIEITNEQGSAVCPAYKKKRQSKKKLSGNESCSKK